MNWQDKTIKILGSITHTYFYVWMLYKWKSNTSIINVNKLLKITFMGLGFNYINIDQPNKLHSYYTCDLDNKIYLYTFNHIKLSIGFVWIYLSRLIEYTLHSICK